MISFWVLFIYLFLLSLFLPINLSFSTTGGIRLFVVLTLIVLIFFAGFRKYSNDYSSYVDIYNSIPNLFNLTIDSAFNSNLNVEIGFIYFCSFLKLFSNNPVLLFFSVASISISLNILTVHKISPYIFLSILLYYVYNYLLKETIQIRQGLASAFLMASFLYYNNRMKSLFLILIAISVQSTAAVALPFLFIKRSVFKNDSTYYCAFGFVILLTAIFSGRNFIEYLMEIMSLPPSLTVYYGWDEYDYDLGFLNPILAKQVIFSILLIKNRFILIEKYPNFLLMFNFYLFSTLWYIYFNDFAIIAGRISNLFSIGEVILIPMLISISRNHIRSYFYFGFILYSSVILMLNLNSGKIFPYYSIFNN